VIGTQNELLRKLLRQLQAERLKLLERKDRLANVATIWAGTFDRIEFEQFVADYVAYQNRALAAVVELDAGSDPLALEFSCADARMLRSLDLVQEQLESGSPVDWAVIAEASAQQQIAYTEMAELVALIGFDPEEPQP